MEALFGLVVLLTSFVLPCDSQFSPGVWMQTYRQTSASDVDVFLAVYNVTESKPAYVAHATIRGTSALTITFEKSVIDTATKLVYSVTDVSFAGTQGIQYERHIHIFDYSSPKEPTVSKTVPACPLTSRVDQQCLVLHAGDLWAILPQKNNQTATDAKALSNFYKVYDGSSGKCPPYDGSCFTPAITSSIEDGCAVANGTILFVSTDSLIHLTPPTVCQGNTYGTPMRTDAQWKSSQALGLMASTGDTVLWVTDFHAAGGWYLIEGFPSVQVPLNGGTLPMSLDIGFPKSDQYTGPTAVDSTKKAGTNQHDLLFYYMLGNKPPINAWPLGSGTGVITIRTDALPSPAACQTCTMEATMLYDQSLRFPTPPPPPSPSTPTPQPPAPSNFIGVGWILILSVLGIGMLYLLIGMVVMKVTHKDVNDPRELIPNKALWVEGFGLVKDGMTYTKDGIVNVFQRVRRRGDRERLLDEDEMPNKSPRQ